MRRFLWLRLVLALILAVPFNSTLLLNAARLRDDTSIIRQAPPAPVIEDEARRAELARRRARVAEKIGPRAVLVLFGAEPRVYSNDVDYEYRQENNLFYLTNLNQQGIRLVMMPGNSQLPEILFLPRRDPRLETWTGRMYSPEDAQRISGIGEIWDAREFEPFMRALRLRQPYRPKDDGILLSRAFHTNATDGQSRNASSANGRSSFASNVSINLSNASLNGFDTLFAAARDNEAAIYLLLPPDREVRDGSESREFRQEQRFAAQWAQGANGYAIRSAWPIFAEMRMVKSPIELQLLQHAIDITTEALERAMALAASAKWEYELKAEVEYIFRRRNAFWGYPSIVGCGPNATTLHYEDAQGPIRAGDLLLMDVGAEYGHYSADITRTFPVSGKFSQEQADIYNIVFEAQEAAMRAVRPGATLTEVHNAALAKIKDGLFRLGLITDKDSDQYRIWFMHGTSHMIGLNVHDLSQPGAKLAPGMVFTVEPGIYVREDALDNLPNTPEYQRFKQAIRQAFEKYRGIGVRIEDDVLVTENGFKNLSAAVPRSIPEIEAFIARARAKMGREAPEAISASVKRAIAGSSGALASVAPQVASTREFSTVKDPAERLGERASSPLSFRDRTTRVSDRSSLGPLNRARHVNP